MQVRFVEKLPPAGTGRPDMNQLIAKQLKSNPGKWGIIKESDKPHTVAMVTVINQGKSPAFAPAGAFKAASRTKNGKVTIYAQYVGDQKLA